MKTISIILSGLACMGFAHAGVLFVDDFNSYDEGALPTGGLWQTAYDNDDTWKTRVVTDTTDIFGQGVDNKYLYMNFKAGGSTVAAITDVTTGTSTGQLSFNFYDVTDSGGTGSGFCFRIGTGNANGVTAFALCLTRGSFQLATGSSVNPTGTYFSSYSMDALHSLTIVFNNSSTTTLTYDGGTVAALSMDIWLDGVLVGNDMAGTGISTMSDKLLDEINITTKSTTFIDSMYIDDLTFSNAVTIPEPGTVTCMSVGAVFLLGCFMFSRRPAKAS